MVGKKVGKILRKEFAHLIIKKQKSTLFFRKRECLSREWWGGTEREGKREF